MKFGMSLEVGLVVGKEVAFAVNIKLVRLGALGEMAEIAIASCVVIYAVDGLLVSSGLEPASRSTLVIAAILTWVG
jgi:hypothetical protein